jgi:hypothetical protein
LFTANKSPVARVALDTIRELYKLERKIKHRSADKKRQWRLPPDWRPYHGTDRTGCKIKWRVENGKISYVVEHCLADPGNERERNVYPDQYQ